jgi:hypothetical protein
LDRKEGHFIGSGFLERGAEWNNETIDVSELISCFGRLNDKPTLASGNYVPPFVVVTCKNR